MNKVGKLLKIHFLNYLNWNRTFHEKNAEEKRKGRWILCLTAGSVLSLMGLSAVYFYQISEVLFLQKQIDILPAFLITIPSILILFTSIMRGSNVIFDSKDVDIILPLPISNRQIVFSKIASLYIVNLFFSSFVFFPGYLFYGFKIGMSHLYYLVGIILFLCIPMIPMAIGIFLSTMIRFLSVRLKHKNFFQILFSLILLLGFFSYSFTQGQENQKQVLEMQANTFQKVSTIYPLEIIFKQALIEQDGIAILIFIGISIFSIISISVLIGKNYKKYINRLVGIGVSSKYNRKLQRHATPITALYKRDIKRYFSSVTYVMNTGIGSILMVFFSILVSIRGENFVQSMGTVSLSMKQVQLGIPFLLGAMVSMTNITSVSFSMEGKSFPLLKSYPISFLKICVSKILLNMTITIPAVVISATILGICMDLPMWIWIECYIIPFIYAVIMPIFGLLINLLLPNFSWTNEIQVVKQSMASMIGILGGMLFGTFPVILAFGFGQKYPALFLIITLLFLILTGFSLVVLLKKWGEKKFRML